jgi:hypothetical protein
MQAPVGGPQTCMQEAALAVNEGRPCGGKQSNLSLRGFAIRQVSAKTGIGSSDIVQSERWRAPTHVEMHAASHRDLGREGAPGAQLQEMTRQLLHGKSS